MAHPPLPAPHQQDTEAADRLWQLGMYLAARWDADIQITVTTREKAAPVAIYVEVFRSIGETGPQVEKIVRPNPTRVVRDDGAPTRPDSGVVSTGMVLPERLRHLWRRRLPAPPADVRCGRPDEHEDHWHHHGADGLVYCDGAASR